MIWTHPGGEGLRPVSFQITQGEEALTSHSGLALIGALMGRTRLAARVDEISLAEVDPILWTAGQQD